MEPATIKLGIGLLLLAVANIALGSMNAFFDGSFDFKKLRNGVLKGAIVVACFVAFYAAGRLNPDIVAINVEGQEVNVATAANVSMVSAYVVYATDVFTKLSKLVLNKTDKPPDGTDDPDAAAEVTAY